MEEPLLVASLRNYHFGAEGVPEDMALRQNVFTTSVSAYDFQEKQVTEAVRNYQRWLWWPTRRQQAVLTIGMHAQRLFLDIHRRAGEPCELQEVSLEERAAALVGQ